MLVFPPEAAAAHQAVGFEDGDLDELSPHAGRLAVGDGDERVAVDGLDEAVAEGVEGGAERAHLVATQDPLLDGRVDRTVVDERAAGVVDEIDAVEMAGPDLGDLADGPRNGVLVAFGAGLSVVDGTEAVVDRLDLFEDSAVGVERQLVGGEAVRQVVEARRGLGRCIGEGGRQHEPSDRHSEEGQP